MKSKHKVVSRDFILTVAAICGYVLYIAHMIYVLGV